MGRFDALSALDNKPSINTPPQALATSRKPILFEEEEPITIPTKKPEIMKTRKPNLTAPSTSLQLTTKPEKYSTLLETALIKKIKIYATEADIKDYQVIARALNEFFEKGN